MDRGKGGELQLESSAIRGGLNVWISISAIRDWCNPGGNSWCLFPASLIKYFMVTEHSLFSMCRFG